MPEKPPTRLPTNQEMQDLASYLPRLYAPGFEPVVEWQGGDQRPDGVFTLPYPLYDPLVEDFVRQLRNECWLDYNYIPEEAASMLSDHEFVKTASLEQVKTMLTYCLRGERFSDGHWEEMIKGGNFRRLLERISELGKVTY